MHSFIADWMSVLFLLAVLTVAGQNPPSKAVPIRQEPLHHLALENKYTRVFKVEVPVGKQTLLHRHDHDYVFITLGPAEIENVVQAKPAVKQKLADGDARYVRGQFAHVARNMGSTPFRNITIEVLKPGAERPAMEDERGMDIGHGSTSEILVNNSKVRVEDVQIAAGDTLDPAQLPRLIVALSDCELALADAKNKPKHLAAGDFEWLPAGHSLATLPGSRQTHLISVEFR